MASVTAICDNGTGVVKAGFAGDTQPRVVFPCTVARSSGSRDVLIGGDAAACHGSLTLNYPMANGIVQNWADMELVWSHTWSQLGIEPGSSYVLLTDAALNPVANRKRVVETMLEQYGFQGVNLQVQAVLTLYGHGVQSGVVMDSGDGVSHAVAVVDGYAYSHLTQRLAIAGRHITEHLMDLLIQRGVALHRTADLDLVRCLKEQACYVAPNLQQELKVARETTAVTQSYSLPDGRVIKLGMERFQAPEALFQPGLLDKEQPGVADMVFNVINECDMDTRPVLYKNVIISGGSTMFPGFATRMEAELRQLYSLRENILGVAAASRVRLHASPNRQHLVFMGASVLGDMMQGQPDFWISRADWEEDPHRALAKCGLAQPLAGH
ncbi:actin-related protein [Haematococcus lacustris]